MAARRLKVLEDSLGLDSSVDEIPVTPEISEGTKTPMNWRNVRKVQSSESEGETSIGDSPQVIPESESDGSDQEEDNFFDAKDKHEESDEESFIVTKPVKKRTVLISEDEDSDQYDSQIEKSMSVLAADDETDSELASESEEEENQDDQSYIEPKAASESEEEESENNDECYVKTNFESETESGAPKDDDDSFVFHPNPAIQKTPEKKENVDDSVEILESSIAEENSKLNPQEILDLQKSLSEAEKRIARNQMLLSTTGGGVLLPDKGAKIKNDLERAKTEASKLTSQLGQVSSSSGSLVIGDEDRLNLLHKKARILSQQYSALGYNNQNTSGGMSIKKQLDEANKQIMQLEPLVRMTNPRYEAPKPPGVHGTPLKQINKSTENSGWAKAKDHIYDTWKAFRNEDHHLEQGPAANRLYGGRMNDARRQVASMVTQDAMAKLHKALETMPAETDEEEQPLGLRSKFNLYPHQKQGLAWLIWRESQIPAGGILADDMGLGKTLTLISLIQKQKEMAEDEENEDNEWLSKKGSKNAIRSRGTLVVCPASLIGHWEKEVKSKVRSNCLTTLVYHGAGREISARRLAKYDMVITTYGTAQSEISKVLPEEGKKSTRLDDLKPIDLDNIDTKDAVLLNVVWERIILDEAHVIRNPIAKTSKAICRLRAAKRWVVTGTPIQNEEKDMFSLIRFLRVTPFDEWSVWKHWVDKSPMGQQRMNTIVKSCLLRRTKDQKSTVTGEEIVSLPPKQVQVHTMKLGVEERKVYDEVFSFSRQAMVNYMKKHEEKKADHDMIKQVQDNEYKFRPDFNVEGEAQEMANKFSQGSEIKAHHLLVLLLRLRQICDHPGLIKTMLEEETKASEGLLDNNDDQDLVNQLSGMSLNGVHKKGDSDMELKVLDPGNPIFKEAEASSKINTVLGKLKELKKKQEETGIMEKAVVVSQWTSMLNIIRGHVKQLGFKVAEINGSIAVKSRGDIVEDFNKVGSGAQVMLLSLAAGGVGLNLIGANHLFLLDMHWNPQLEAQACDRIYRVGQKREVTIHKFFCEDTVESRILDLQNKKMDLANSVLTGAKRTNANRLTLDDLKMLFDLNRK